MSCNEWKEYRLDDISLNITDGKHGNCKDEENSGYYFISAKDIKEGKIDYRNARQITKADYEDVHKRTKLEVDDILITNSGTIGKMAIITDKDEVNATTFQKSVAIVKPIKNLVLPKFLYYNLIYDLKYLINLAGGSVQKNLLLKDLRSLKVNLPNFEEQEKIANILSSLDDKIELNNEMNKTLEEMAQALFKRWFVDFEFPNEDGKPYKSSGGEMVESELGMIPKGWEVKTIGDIGDIITGKTPSSKDEGSYGNECNFITPRDINNSVFILKTERELSSIGIEKLKRNIVPKNSIGVSCIGSNLGEVYINGEDSITNQQINTIVLNEGKLLPYIYIYLKNMKEDFLNIAGGSAVPIINKTTFSGINILIPDINLLHRYVQITTCYFDKIKENLKEIENLTELRDTLLPKLMSGEIRAK